MSMPVWLGMAWVWWTLGIHLGKRSESPRASITFGWESIRWPHQWVVCMWDGREKQPFTWPSLSLSTGPCPYHTVDLLTRSRFSGIFLNNGRRGYFSWGFHLLYQSPLVPLFINLWYQRLWTKLEVVWERRKEGQMKGILCGFRLITVSVWELLSHCWPYHLFRNHICSFPLLGVLVSKGSVLCMWAMQVLDVLARGLYSVCGQYRHWSMWGRKVPTPI